VDGTASGSRLAAWRFAHGLTLRACAKGAGVTRTTWRRAERGLGTHADSAYKIQKYVMARGGWVDLHDFVSESLRRG
jgi:transcriptional regulator with XRE-family HTH domain